MPHEVYTRTRRCDDIARGVAKDLDELTRRRQRAALKAAVVERLPATGLPFRHFTLHAESFQHAHHIFERIREKILAETGEKELRLYQCLPP
jgi:hypothetical protein